MEPVSQLKTQLELGRAVKRREVDGREVLRKILSDSQWADFEKYNSFREIIHSADGLPAYPIEFGKNYAGFIEFHQHAWHSPKSFRNVYIDSSERDWMREDEIVVVLLNVRLFGKEHIERDEFACFSSINSSSKTWKQLYNRTYHLDS